ncbi:MAG: iron ABC transporter permease [Archaeoglobaceae archaeon]|nr:iron ABC transporter permease [Archaeoglobales archaeon]
MNIKIGTIIALNLLVFIISLTVGSSRYGFEDLIRLFQGTAEETARTIILEYRLPRLLLAVIVGASLSASGCSLQALFRNPLAEPYVLGIASGASLGAILSVILGLNVFGRILFAFLFSILTVYLVFLIGSTKKFRDQNYAILLAGIAIASFLSGLNSLLIYLHSQNLHKVIFWLMGSFSNPQWEEIYFCTPCLIIGLSFLLATSWNLNALLLGDEHAKAVGIDVDRYRSELIIFTSLLTSTAVAVSGVIGFVGIIIPHTVRILIGEEHRQLLPTTILLSTAFMPFVDMIARISISGEIPVGAITAMLGGPFFLYLLLRRGI